jgi:AraC-like DNA-binding protein
MTGAEQKNSLCAAIGEQIILRIRRAGMSQVLTAPPTWRALQTADRELPAGMTATHHPLRGRRVAVGGGRPYGTAVVEAKWPADNLLAARTPKLCFILAGEVVYPVADYMLHCRPGHGILLPPGIPFGAGDHPLLKAQRGVCQILQLMPYHGGLLCWISRRWEEQGQRHISEEICSVPQSHVPFYLNQLVAETTRPGLYQQLVCDSLLNLVLTLLHRELQELPVVQTGEIDLAGGAASAAQREYSIAQAQEYIHHHLREPLSIDKVARLTCMSRTTFTEQFRLNTGKTFAQYVQDHRFSEARKLLAATDLTVRDIGSLVGLRPNRLRTLFRELEGLSPTKFRHEARR